jgi:hypothetical protein
MEVFWTQAFWIGILLVFVFFGYLDHRTKRRRLEMLHEERLIALEKGVPLPELPEFGPPPKPVSPRVDHPNAGAITGIVLLCAGLGGMGALIFSHVENLHKYWSTPLPLALVGYGLFNYFLIKKRD